jgi:hypothetical protein
MPMPDADAHSGPSGLRYRRNEIPRIPTERFRAGDFIGKKRTLERSM